LFSFCAAVIACIDAFVRSGEGHIRKEGRLATAGWCQVKPGYCVFNKTNECFLGLNVTPAFTSLARLKGLLGKLRLPQGEGLWLVPSQGIHTFGMLFPIDVIFLDEEQRVIHLIEHMRPFRVTRIRLNCASVLELPAHTIYSSQTHVGDQLVIGPIDELLLPAPVREQKGVIQ
jgi:uncharacterized membrane protein (UPF0127 family)